MLVKYYSQEKHGEALIKALDRLLKHKVRLNPKKCIFGGIKEKLLGFIVSICGIEIDPNKVIKFAIIKFARKATSHHKIHSLVI